MFEVLAVPSSRSIFCRHTTGWSRGLEVSGGGQGVVSHAGLVLLRHLAGKTGLTGGLSRALATPRFLVHDRGRVTADLACAIADGARVISDFRVMSDQRELFGLVASVPTAWRALKEMAWRGAGGPADHGGGEYGPAARVGAGRGPARRAARGAAGGPDPGRGDLHQARDLATRYTLACAAADAGDWEQALIAFMMIADVEPGYRDVRERAETIRRQQQIEALQVEARLASPGPAVGGRHTDRGAAVPAGPGRRGPGGDGDLGAQRTRGPRSRPTASRLTTRPRCACWTPGTGIRPSTSWSGSCR